MADRRVSVGVVNYNGAPYLMQTLRAVGHLGPVVDDVLLVDSGSTDDGLALVREQFPEVRVIELGANLGPGAARNRAIREAVHDRVLLIDNDIELQPGGVDALAAALDSHPEAVLAMPAVLYQHSPDTVQYVGASPHFLGTPMPLYAETPVAQLEALVRVVGSVISACLLVDRARFGDRRWFDDTFSIYMEDHELGLRASLQGYSCLIVPEARCLHRAGTVGMSIRQTGRFTPTRVRHTIRNRWLTILMLYQTTTLLRFAPALATFEVFQLLGAIKRGWIGHWFWAARSTVRMLPHVRRVRRDMRASRRREDLEVLRTGPFPFNPAWHQSAFERMARHTLDTIARLNWRMAGGRAP